MTHHHLGATGAKMAAEFDAANSKVSEERMEEWRGRDLTGDLEGDAIPGVGPATIEKFKANEETKSTYRLIGSYFSGITEGETTLGAAQKFKDLLEEHGTPKQYQDTVVTAIVEKILAGFRITMQMDEARLSSSRMSHADVEAFLAKELTGNLAKDFKGISEATAKKMNEDGGVANTWMFFALALQSENADDFEATIKDFGIAGGWSATVVHQVVEKLAAGLQLPYE